jgi:hypothetical protein
MTRINNRQLTFIIKHSDLLVCLFLSVATFAVYWQVQTCDFVFDDFRTIVENRHVQSGFNRDSIIWSFTSGTSVSRYWHPLTWLSHILDVKLYGMNAGGHHLTNLFIHIANTLMLFFVFRKMTGALWQSGFVTALFALHPLHVESVVWISERKGVLSTFFWFLTMCAYCRYTEQPGFIRYVVVFFFFVLDLMSKPMLVTLPFVLLLMDYWPLKRLQMGQAGGEGGIKARKASIFHLVVEKIPFFILAVIVSIAAFVTQQKGGAVPSDSFSLLTVQTANALVSYVSYIIKMIWPSRLAVYYPFPGILPLWQAVAGGALIITLSVVFIMAGRRFAYLPTGWFWYLGTLVPVIGLVKVGNFAMADRYTYVTLIGLFIMIAWGVPDLLARWRYRKTGFVVSATILLAILMALTWRQVGYWENNITLFEHTLKVTTGNYLSHYNLGTALEKQGRTEEAIEHYLQALRINPDYVDAYNNLGVSLFRKGDIDGATERFREALRINPEYVRARNNLERALMIHSKSNN